MDYMAHGTKYYGLLYCSPHSFFLEVMTFVKLINRLTPFLHPMGEKHHLSLANLVKEREILHENLGAMGESSIQQNNGLYDYMARGTKQRYLLSSII